MDFDSITPYNTNDEADKAVTDYEELMVKMPTFTDSAIDLPYRLHQPEQAEANPDETYPLVVYLHGGASRGTDGDAQVQYRHVLPFLASSNSLLTDENQALRPTYVVIPQCDCQFGSNEWASGGYGPFAYTDTPSYYGQALEDLIEHLVATYQVDPRRIYVTGISMGGGGAWDIAARRPDLIAAAIPLSGHPLRADDAAQIFAESKVPVWANQGEGDENNSINDTRNTVNAIADAGGCATLTAFPRRDNWQDIDPGDAEQGNGGDINHTVWMRAYMNPALWDWVFSIEQPVQGE